MENQTCKCGQVINPKCECGHYEFTSIADEEKRIIGWSCDFCKAIKPFSFLVVEIKIKGQADVEEGEGNV